MNRIVQLFFILLFAHYSWCKALDCTNKLKLCDKDFQDAFKQIKFAQADVQHADIYSELCSHGGIYNRFTTCVFDSAECSSIASSSDFRKQVCGNRQLKMNIYRYTWKYSLINDICFRTATFLDADFFKFEKCISKVINAPNWECDMTHYKMVKQTNREKSCPHWTDFRTCSYDAVKQNCGDAAANVSDFLFHVHSGYFSKYTFCNLSGENSTNCWYDWMLERMPTTTTTSTTIKSTINSPTMSSMESKNEPAGDTKWEASASTQHSTFVSVQSDEHSTEESTEWNRAEATSSNSRHDTLPVPDKNSKTNFEMVVEDNSIHNNEETKTKTISNDSTDMDDDDDDNDGYKDDDGISDDHGDSYRRPKHSSERRKEKVKSSAEWKYSNDTSIDHQDSSNESNNKELYQNDSGLKVVSNSVTHGDSEPSQAAIIARESKEMAKREPVPDKMVENNAKSHPNTEASQQDIAANIKVGGMAKPIPNGSTKAVSMFYMMHQVMMSIFIFSVLHLFAA